MKEGLMLLLVVPEIKFGFFIRFHLEDLSNTDDLRYKLMDHFCNYKENRIIPKYQN